MPHKYRVSIMHVALLFTLASFLLSNRCLAQEAAAFSCCTEYPCKEKESCPSGASGCATRYVNGEIVKRGCILPELLDCYREQQLLPVAGSCVDTHFIESKSERFSTCERNIGSDSRIYKVQLTSEDERDNEHVVPETPPSSRKKVKTIRTTTAPSPEMSENEEDDSDIVTRKKRSRRKRSEEENQNQGDQDFGLNALSLGKDKGEDTPGTLLQIEKRSTEHRICYCTGNLCNANKTSTLNWNKAEILQVILFVVGVMLIGNH